MKSGNHWLVKSNRLGWIARIWTLLLLYFMVARILTPDPYATGGPVPLEDWFLLGFWALAIFALLVAWRWPALGAVLAIATMFARELTWVVLKGPWLPAFLLIWAAVIPPALFYLLSWRKSRPETHA